MPPTLSRAIQIALGTWRAALRVSSEAPTQASKPMKTQPPTASAASSPAAVDPPDSASAPSVSVKIEKCCSLNASSSASPIPTDASASIAIPTRIVRASTFRPSAPTSEHTSTRIIPVATMAWDVGSTPNRVSAQGAPR